MKEIKEVHLEWQINPSDFVTHKIERFDKGYQMNIDKDRVTVVIDCSILTPTTEAIESIHNHFMSELRAVQLLNQNDFQCHSPSRIDYYSNGNKGYHLACETGKLTFSGSLHISVYDKNGNIKLDQPDAQKIHEQKDLSERLRKHENDNTLKFIIDRIDLSYKDPDHSISYLFDIREAIKTRLTNDYINSEELNKFNKKEDFVIDKLQISGEWKYLGVIANRKQIIEGRHVGINYDVLRSITNEELKETRSCILRIIKSFLTYLDSSVL